MDALYTMQKDLQKQISAAFPNFKKKGAAKMTIITAQARLAGLEKAYSQFEDIHQRILTSKTPADHEYYTSNLNELVIDTYYDQKGEFLQFIEDAKQKEREKNPLPRPTSPGHNVTLNSSTLEAHALPKMNLPKFSGKFSEWENFRDLFRSIVHRRTDLDAAIKYFHLRSNLTGEALDHIKSIPIAADQYEGAWQTLISYYDNKRRTISTHISAIMNVKPMRAETDAELKRIYREMFSPVESLRKLGRTDADIGNDLLVHVAVELMEANTKREWKKSIDKSNDNPPTLAQLKTFIAGQIENLDKGKDSLNSSKAKNQKNKSTHNSSDLVTVQSLQTSSKDSSRHSPSSTKSANCALCNADHYISKCDQFTKKSALERREFVRAEHLCFNCLGGGHPQSRCRSRYVCFTCKRKHHTLLHVDDNNSEKMSSVTPQTIQHSSNPSQSNAGSGNVSENLNVLSTAQVAKHAGVLLVTALVNVAGPLGKVQKVRALIDPGSQVSLVTQQLCEQLSLPLEHTNIKIDGVGERSSVHANKLVSLHLQPHFTSSFTLEIDALVLRQITSYRPPNVRSGHSLEFLQGLQLADPCYIEYHPVEVLLGADAYAEIIDKNIVKGPANQPMALQSKLGWLLTGKITSPAFFSSSFTHTVTVNRNDSVSNQDLYDMLREFWRTEEVTENKNSRSKEEEVCEHLYANTTTRTSDGRYTVRLPWKDPSALGKFELGSSYPRALNALKRLETSFQKDQRLEVEYTKFIQEYIDLGHMTAIEEAPSTKSDYFFLPHHGVWKENSSTTKLRTVFNGSSRLNSGESLNDLLYAGPNLLLHPVDLVNKIRNYVIALSADVEKMFRQVGAHPDDRKFQAILWRFKPSQRIKIYLLNTVTYGLAPSLYLALRTLLQMASDHEQEHPIAATVVKEEMYSDNVLSGAHSLEDAKEKVDDLVKLFAKGQMNLRKWSSNNSQALSALKEEMLATEKVALFSADSTIPLLGIAWHIIGDYFGFQISDLIIPLPVTKRSILSRIARTYDPLGWIAPVIIIAKILLQTLWLQKLGWDDPVPENIKQQWSAMVVKSSCN